MTNQEAKNITCKKIAWTIRNFSSLKANEPHYSEVFTVCNFAWKLLIYKGQVGNNKSLAIFLEAADASSLPQGWSVLTAFSLTVVNQVSRKKSRTEGDADVPDKFYANKKVWGYPFFMPLSELEDPSRGYISNDKCIVEVELFSVTFEGFEPTKDNDIVDFKDLGKIEKSFIPLLEDVCSWYPSLLESMKNKSRKFTECALNALGRVLQFLKDKKWKDMNEEVCEQLQYLWEELEMIRLDLSWLEPIVKSAINMKGYAEKVEKVKMMKQNLMVAETEMNMIKQKMSAIDQNIEIIKKKLVNAEEDFEEQDLDAEIGYGKP